MLVAGWDRQVSEWDAVFGPHLAAVAVADRHTACDRRWLVLSAAGRHAWLGGGLGYSGHMGGRSAFIPQAGRLALLCTNAFCSAAVQFCGASTQTRK